MKRANALSLLAVTALLVAAPAAVALAGSVQGVPAPSDFAGYANVDLTNGTSSWQAAPAPVAAVNIYNNTTGGILTGVASTDLFSVWGDAVTTTGTGILDQTAFTIYNAGGGPLLTAAVAITFYDAVTSNPIGGFNTNINFGAGLPVGTVALVTTSGISVLNINLSTTNILMTQQITGLTGTSTSLGVALMTTPPAIGVGSPAMFINSSTVGPAGFYTVNGVNEADPGYRIATLEPTPTQTKTWGGVKGEYRGR